MRMCPRCQNEVKDDDLFCPYCGTRLPSKEESEAEAPKVNYKLGLTSGRALAGMIVGIISTVFAVLFFFVFSILEIIPFQGGVAAIIISATALKTGDDKAKVGLTLGIIATVVAFIVFFIWLGLNGQFVSRLR